MDFRAGAELPVIFADPAGTGVSAFARDFEGGGRLTYGIDHVLGFFAEIRWPGRRKVEYDAFHPLEFKFERPLEGLLYFCVRHRLFTEEELHDALLYVEEPTTSLLPSRVQLAVEVVSNLKWAAAD